MNPPNLTNKQLAELDSLFELVSPVSYTHLRAHET